MPRAIPTIPRKSASQKRSRAMVETLLDATARVLTREGYDRASTNRIASLPNRCRGWASSPKSRPLQRETFLLIRAYLEERRDEILGPRSRFATFICVTTAEALTHEYVINKPDALADDRERFIDEVARLLMGYLTPGSTPRAGPRRPAAGRARSA